jgi:ATP-binding cassette subfamily C protein CydCD
MYFDRRLWSFTKGVRLRIAISVTLGVVSAAVGIARLALLGWLLAQVFEGASFSELLYPSILVAVVMILRGFLEYTRTMVAHRTAAQVQLHIRSQLYDQIVELGPAYLGLERTGAVISSMIDGVKQLEVYFGQYLPQLFVAGLTPIGIFVFVAYIDLPVAAVLTLFALITLIAPQAFHSMERDNSLRRSRAYKDFAAEFLDAIQGLSTLKSFGQSGARARLLADKALELFSSTMWVLATNCLARGITDCGIAIGSAATLALGAWRVRNGDMSLSALLMILMMGVETFRPLRQLRALLHQGMVSQASAQAIFELMDASPLVFNTKKKTGILLEPTIEFDNVTFSYPGGRRPAHNELSFKVKSGERVSIVGPSGCGKSSIVRLLLRQFDPQKGCVMIGGKDLRDLGLEDIRSQLAVVNQDTYLFHGSVEENLRFGKPNATQEELEAAARSANAHYFIKNLPKDYRIVVGERGIKLSGGQRQRIAIARALLRDAPILILDEALSAVDAENEAIIQDALDRLMVGRTTLILAHRLSSVIDSDRIIVIENGCVVESGAHKDLIQANGPYQELMGAQVRDHDAEDYIQLNRQVRDTMFQEYPVSSLNFEAQMDPTDAILRAEGMGWGACIRELSRFIEPWKTKLVLTFFFGVVRTLAYIGVGVFSALTVAAIKNGQPYGSYLIWLAFAAPTAGILHWCESWVAHDMAFRLLSKMRIDLFEKLDQLAPAYLLRRRTGDLIGMATHDVEKVEYFFAHTIAPAFVAILVPSIVLVALFTFGWPLAAVLIPFLAVVALSPFLLRKRIDKLGAKASEALGNLNAFTVDTIQGLAEILAFQQISHRRENFIEKIRHHHSIRMPYFSDLAAQTAVLEGATGLGGLAMVVVGARLSIEGSLDPAYLPMLSLIAMAAFLPVSEIAQVGRQLAETLASTQRLFAVHSEPVLVKDGPGIEIDEESQRVKMQTENVTYSYYGGIRPALRDVSFTAPTGYTIALVGPSGAGKTTLAHLMMRFWDPDEGVLRMDGHDLRDFKLDDLRRRIALVAQDTYLFNDTLGSNIAIAKPDATSQELDKAIDRASLREFVDGLPQGLETRVGERGMQLSGGQRQRVAIARAFLKDAPVLILDEATSHLDAVNEAAVRGALGDLMADRTTVIIAHRLSTVRDADMIVVMDEGSVMEIGTHSSLLKRGGLYAKLVSRQITGAIPVYVKD